MENLYSSSELAKKYGLSRARVNNVGKILNLRKIGTAYVWTDKDVEFLVSRVGQRGKRL